MLASLLANQSIPTLSPFLCVSFSPVVENLDLFLKDIDLGWGLRSGRMSAISLRPPSLTISLVLRFHLV